ncbi:Rieske (2Fe-2S) protein [Streptomyces thermolineatus]|uniref:Cytochrome bc1 complex Rieske iron-sulfur subunit n=1 Tax=Streptomyces thermolineatus TaxID=44033 RepID=A0ABP5ZH93_9ACTN
MENAPGRRTVVAAAAVGAAALAAGCSGYGGRPAEAAQGGADGEEIARTSDVPLGGGTVLPERKIVITQPEQDRFRAFSAICTHQGCLVSQVADGHIECGCHGSRFAIEDGAPAGGPATRPLAEERIVVRGDSIRQA